ncbi:hypothetical protein PPL_06529 [Heterostelium album PN500]|uniref:Uncharacterized protein n=1 Tax=Heterostelium pallidum (strain ATCC 26659 / Pp 5 / PN500) TaxID=670386 RepID=D3BDE6_HETP5|nr:hypothetical protein PPL_06529 [Heterostelium album PN500]EFA80590.1 hypothetical protein PPL_06529 [Heterostelium album PN500]|eukprot:XP_020432710.1 hypothetical protein PPL_06529 [Heterostelium album PN500]
MFGNNNNDNQAYRIFVKDGTMKDKVIYLLILVISTSLMITGDNKYIHLNSYKSIIIDQINRKTKCKAIVGDDFYQYYYDYLISKDELDDIDRLKTLNIDKLKLVWEDHEDSKENIKKVYRLISHLNISKLKCVHSCSGLPMNITSMSFDYSFDERLVSGCLPPNLKTLKFGRYFDQRIKSGVLPNTLIKLIFNESFNQTIEQGVLPSSLKVLKFKESNFQQDIKVGTFPPNLEVLEFSGKCSALEDGALPQTLRILAYAPTSWLPQIKTLPNLKILTISYASEAFHMDLNCLPVSLTRLEIFSNIKLINVMPPTIRYLNLEHCDYDFNGVFKDRSIYQLDFLRLNPKQVVSLDGMKIKELELNMRTYMSFVGKEVDIPFGVETLSIQYASKFQKEIPSSVKKLVFSKEIHCIDDLQKRYDMTGSASIQELIIICDEISFSHRISVYIPPIIFPPKTLIELPDILNEKIWIRMIDNQHYLVFSQSPIITSIVHVSQLYQYIIYIIDKYQKLKYQSYKGF